MSVRAGCWSRLGVAIACPSPSSAPASDPHDLRRCADLSHAWTPVRIPLKRLQLVLRQPEPEEGRPAGSLARRSHPSRALSRRRVLPRRRRRPGPGHHRSRLRARLAARLAGPRLQPRPRLARRVDEPPWPPHHAGGVMSPAGWAMPAERAPWSGLHCGWYGSAIPMRIRADGRPGASLPEATPDNGVARVGLVPACGNGPAGPGPRTSSGPGKRTRPGHGSRTMRTRSGPGPGKPVPPAMRQRSSLRRSPGTGPASRKAGRCRSASWRACSARPRGVGHAVAWPKPGRAWHQHRKVYLVIRAGSR